MSMVLHHLLIQLMTLKDLLGETLQDMLNSEFDEHMGYNKYDTKNR